LEGTFKDHLVQFPWSMTFYSLYLNNFFSYSITPDSFLSLWCENLVTSWSVTGDVIHLCLCHS